MDFSQSTAWPALHPPLLTRLPRPPVHPNPASLPPSQRYKSNQFPTLQDEADQLDWDEDQWINSVGAPLCFLCCPASYSSSWNQARRGVRGLTPSSACSVTASRHSRIWLLVAHPTGPAEHARGGCRGAPSLSLPFRPFAQADLSLSRSHDLLCSHRTLRRLSSPILLLFDLTSVRLLLSPRHLRRASPRRSRPTQRHQRRRLHGRR